MKREKVALLLRGGISNTYGKLVLKDDIKNKSYVNFKCVKAGLEKHLFSCNEQYDFDIFIHSWNIDLQEELNLLYSPKLSLFEDNEIYRNQINKVLNNCNVSEQYYNQVSQALAIKKSFELVKNNINNYKYVIFYRPDVLLWKNLDLESYDLDTIYCNGYGNGQGDFHFVMSAQNAQRFYLIYDFLSADNPPFEHQFISNHVRNFLKTEIVCDNIQAGVFQEVVRKLRNSIDLKYLREEQLPDYNISINEICSYNF